MVYDVIYPEIVGIVFFLKNIPMKDGLMQLLAKMKAYMLFW